MQTDWKEMRIQQERLPEKAADRHDWRVVLPLGRLGPIRLPLWNCHNDIFWSVLSSWSNWWNHTGADVVSNSSLGSGSRQRAGTKEACGSNLLRQRWACRLGSHCQGQEDQIMSALLSCADMYQQDFVKPFIFASALICADILLCSGQKLLWSVGFELK